jgi:hypothetical protein
MRHRLTPCSHTLAPAACLSLRAALRSSAAARLVASWLAARSSRNSADLADVASCLAALVAASSALWASLRSRSAALVGASLSRRRGEQGERVRG